MTTSISIIPDDADLHGFLGVRGKLDPSGIPWLKVAALVTVQFQPADHEFAVRYLTKIADEARALAQQIAEAHPEQTDDGAALPVRRDGGDAPAAAPSSPHPEQQS